MADETAPPRVHKHPAAASAALNFQHLVDDYRHQLVQLSSQLRLHAQSMLDSLESIAAHASEAVEMMTDVSSPKPDLWVAPPADLARSVAALIAPAFEGLQAAVRDLPPRIRDAVLTLARRGWYFDVEMPFSTLWAVQKALEDDDTSKADETLTEYFEAHLDSIEAAIALRFPARQRFIEAAFKAHRRAEYALSIPLLLAQTDGICWDATGECLFRRRAGKPRTARYAREIAASGIRSALLGPLTENLPIGQSENERAPDFDLLNRHVVLHGESLDYDTKLNALRAISLINYVAQVLGQDPPDNE